RGVPSARPRRARGRRADVPSRPARRLARRHLRGAGGRAPRARLPRVAAAGGLPRAAARGEAHPRDHQRLVLVCVLPELRARHHARATAAPGHAVVLRPRERLPAGGRPLQRSIPRRAEAAACRRWRGDALHAQRQRRQAEQPALHLPRLRGGGQQAVIRVGFDVTFANRVGTGVGVYARNLAAALARRSVDLRRWEHTLARATNRRRRMTNGVRLAAWQSVGCARQARRDAVDLVHAAAPIGPLGVGCPVVMTVHDATGVTMPLRTNPGDSLFHRVFSEHAARRADALLVPSRAAADDVVEHYGVDASRIRVVPLGVADAFRLVTADDVATVRRAYGLDRPYVLYVGADTPRKNLDRLIAAKASDRRLDELDLVIAGPPARMAGRLEAFGKERGLPRPIRWVFDVPDAALPGLYGGAACLAYVSLWEGFGLPIIEAMAAGVPVVTANRASMPEVAGDAALLVDPTDVPAIADALARAVHD